jgi:hypothetical protein
MHRDPGFPNPVYKINHPKEKDLSGENTPILHPMPRTSCESVLHGRDHNPIGCQGVLTLNG